MLLPIVLFHVCVRIHIDISDIRGRERTLPPRDENVETSSSRTTGRTRRVFKGRSRLRSGYRLPRAPLWRLAGSASNNIRDWNRKLCGTWGARGRARTSW
jgi:hypothetical protein